ncbi:MAG: hypothetical protein AB1641_00815 [Thermodesulfobacteriota bacterium]
MTDISSELPVFGVVEGSLDEVVLLRLAGDFNLPLGPVHVKNGKDHLRRHIKGYNQAAQSSYWIVLVDLNHEAECAPDLIDNWLPKRIPRLIFRVVVREVEAWLLADRERIAHFLGVSEARVPRNPDLLDDPKRKVIELAKKSRKRKIIEDMVARIDSGRIIGNAYTSRLSDFVRSDWCPKTAANNSDSLKRCLKRLAEIRR